MISVQDDFGTLLRRYRTEAGLTQEELGERAGLSANGVGLLERGARRRPHLATVDLLVEALSLEAVDATSLRTAARAGVSLPPAVFEAPGLATTQLGAEPTMPLEARAEELDRICSILASVQESRGHSLLLAGEAGVGKTRLLQELAGEAAARGFVLAVVGCDPAGCHPNMVCRQALSALCAAAPPAVRAEVESRWRLIRDRMQADDSEDGRLADDELFDAAAGLVLTVAGVAPVAFIVDDVQNADETSLGLMHRLCRATHGSPVLVTCAVDGAALEQGNTRLADILQRLSRDHLLEIVALRRLSQDEAALFLMNRVDRVSDEFVAFAFRRTKGNPRLLDGLVRALGGRLRLEEEIGAGAMGRVFRSYDSVTNTTVAAKLMLARAGIDIETLLRFQQEGAVLRSMNHPNIVRIHDSFVEEHVSCIIMELLRGLSLAKVLGQGPLDLGRAKHVGLQIVDALSYAHLHSIVHRDVKPDNIMLVDGWSESERQPKDRPGPGGDHTADEGSRLPKDRAGENLEAEYQTSAPDPEGPGVTLSTLDPAPTVKVTDFGIARILSVDTMMGTIATTGMRVGTPLYMAPEQIQGKNVDARSDLYGFGAVLYHMVTGRPPFDGTDALEIAVKQMQEDPVTPSAVNPQVPSDWDEVILKALSKDPKRRYQSAKEMKAGIEQLGTQPGMAPRRVRRNGWRALAAAAVLVIASSLGLAAYSTNSRDAGTAALSSYLSGLAAQGNLSGSVVLARKGKVILDRGYGAANRAAHIPNGPNTEYGLADATTTALLTADTLQVSRADNYDRGPKSMVCFYAVFLHGCPADWRGLPIRDLVQGTSGLPNYRWGRAGDTIAQTEAACMSRAPARRSSTSVRYTACANVVMGLLDPQTPTTVAAGSWLPTGVVRGRGVSTQPDEIALKGRNPQLAHRLFDGMQSPRLALDYDASGHHASHEYDDYFATYSTADNLLTYDRLLFSGRLMAPAGARAALVTRMETAPRPISAPGDPGITGVRWTDGWKAGYLFGSRVVYTAGSLYNFQTANLVFPRAGVTVIVMSNSASTDALNTAEHAAAFVLPGRQARLAATAAPTVASLVGRYRRPIPAGDDAAITVAYTNGYTAGLPAIYRVGWAQRGLTLVVTRSDFRLGYSQSYSAAGSGALSLFGQPPGLTKTHFCTLQQTDLGPTGYYHWSVLGNQLTITTVRDPFCPNRAGLVAGTWTRIPTAAG